MNAKSFAATGRRAGQFPSNGREIDWFFASCLPLPRPGAEQTVHKKRENISGEPFPKGRFYVIMKEKTGGWAAGSAVLSGKDAVIPCQL